MLCSTVRKAYFLLALTACPVLSFMSIRPILRPLVLPLTSKARTRCLTPTNIRSSPGNRAAMATGNEDSFSSLGIQNTNIETAPGVTLTDKQKVIVGSMLDVSRPFLSRSRHGPPNFTGRVLSSQSQPFNATMAPHEAGYSHATFPTPSSLRATPASSTSACGRATRPSRTPSRKRRASTASPRSGTGCRPSSGPSRCSRTASRARATRSSSSCATSTRCAASARTR